VQDLIHFSDYLFIITLISYIKTNIKKSFSVKIIKRVFFLIDFYTLQTGNNYISSVFNEIKKRNPWGQVAF